jgi:hypothetical protein
MIVLPPYQRDPKSYHQIPEKHRWIYNKIEICKRFGYEPYGPCGTPMPIGEYCIRPIINVNGMAMGGFYKHIVRKEGETVLKAGYVWTKWETGTRSWVEYMNDEVSSSNIQIGWDENTQTEQFMEQPAYKAKPLPEILKGISRYMLVEYLGDVVIDIGLRHLGEEPKESVIRDYRKFDPEYDYVDYRVDYFPTHMKRVQNDDKSYSWEELDIFAQRKIYK